jgi:hypothetical protein
MPNKKASKIDSKLDLPRYLGLIIAIAVILLIVIFAMNNSMQHDNQANDLPGSGNSHLTQQPEVGSESVSISIDGKVVLYKGVEGKTALELLMEYADVDTKDTSFGEQVISINGVEQSGDKYWLYYVNDQPAQMGADQYNTKNRDKIEWRLE